MLGHFSIPHLLYFDNKPDKGRRPSSMVTMETEHFEPSVEKTFPEIPPLTNQGQLPHLDGGFLQTITKASGDGGVGWVGGMQLHIFLAENVLRTENKARTPFVLLTVCDLQQGFGNDTAGDVESLAAIEAAIRVLNIGNGQTTRLGDREAAEGLRRLVGEEETLGRR